MSHTLFSKKLLIYLLGLIVSAVFIVVAHSVSAQTAMCMNGYYNTDGTYVQPYCPPSGMYYSNNYPNNYSNNYPNNSYYVPPPYYNSNYNYPYNNYNNYNQNYSSPPYSCGSGYVWKNGSCISNLDDCRITFGSHIAYGVPGTTNNSICYCESGYDWNSNRTSCVAPYNNISYNNAPYYNNPPYSNPPYSNPPPSYTTQTLAALQAQAESLLAQIQTLLNQLQGY